jgi:nucleotide-binding universal stress UspA family protein
MMYSKILIPLDGSKLSEQILPYARLLAEAFGIPVELLRVNDPASMTPFAPPLQGGEYLKAISDGHFPPSIRVNTAVEGGKTAETIVSCAALDRGTLIAMATHGLSGIQSLFLGSVAYKVVHAAANPLLLVRPVEGHDPSKPIQIKTLLVPLDGSALAEKVLPHVIALAKRIDLEVNLVQAYTVPPESYIVGDGLYMDVLRRQAEAIHKGVDDYLSAKTQELQAEGVSRVVAVAVKGDAAEEIIDLARKTPNCLIAMSTHGRSGIGRWILGSVAAKVVHHSRNPVLVIRPV